MNQKPYCCPLCGDHFVAGDPGVLTDDTNGRTYHLCPQTDVDAPFIPLEPTQELTCELH
jgi:hypothetical protein